ncbi:hypothetical protein L195_g006739, partial [Trifolium pratense]
TPSPRLPVEDTIVPKTSLLKELLTKRPPLLKVLLALRLPYSRVTLSDGPCVPLGHVHSMVCFACSWVGDPVQHVIGPLAQFETDSFTTNNHNFN